MISIGGGETDAFELKRMMRQEAHEKAFEIEVQTQRLFEKERDKLIQIGQAQLEEEYVKKVSKLTQSLNIERSTKVNEARLTKMKKRNECIDLIKKETKDHMLRSVVNPENLSYRSAVKNLIIQSMIKLLEKELNVRCRREDLGLLKQLIPECEQEYQEIMSREVEQAEFNEDGTPATKVEYKTKLILNEDLPLRSEEGGDCGGVILTTTNERIVCNNTL